MLGLLFGTPSARASTEATYSNTAWTGRSVIRTNAGVAVDQELALIYAAVWSATRLLVESISMLPLQIFKKQTNGDREQAPDSSLYSILRYSANPNMGTMAFRECLCQSQINWGNGFAEVERDRIGEVSALWPIHPSRVQANAGDAIDMTEFPYLVRNNDGTQVKLRREEMLHVPGSLTADGIWGRAVIPYARESIGLGIATERYGATNFGSGGQPRAIVKMPGMKNSAERQHFKEDWRKAHGSPDSGEISILPPEAEYIPVSLSAEANQFLGTRDHNIREIARWYRVPPHMIADLKGANRGTVEAMSLEFLIYSLLPWVRKWEEQMGLKLLRPDERISYFIEHQLAGLLRGDITSRMNAYRVAIGIGVMTINECRRLENLNGIGPAGDAHYVPMNMTTAERMLKGLDQATPKPGRGIGSEQSGQPAPDGGDPTGGDPANAVKAMDRLLSGMDTSAAHALNGQAAALERQMIPVHPVTRQAARAVLVDTLSRCFSKEANSAKRAASPGFTGPTWDVWVEEFFAKHTVEMRDALGPATDVLACAGVKTNAADLAGRFAAESKAALTAAYNTDTREVFQNRLSAWSGRAGAAADDVLRG